MVCWIGDCCVRNYHMADHWDFMIYAGAGMVWREIRQRVRYEGSQLPHETNSTRI